MLSDPIGLEPSWFGRLFGPHKDFFDDRLNTMHDSVRTAASDGLTQIVPIILACGLDVPRARRALGRSTWRKIHHASEQTNFMRSLVWFRFKSEATWGEIVDLQDCHLRSCRNAIDWPTARYAGKHAVQGQFSQTALMFSDVVKMGGKPDCKWGLAKLKRDYIKRHAQTKVSCANPEPWAQPFTFVRNGFTFQRLISDRDFIIESNAMRHCVASYQDGARAQDMLVLRCTGKERATIRFDHGGAFEISGFANEPVTKSCSTAAKRAVQEVLRLNPLPKPRRDF